MGPWNSFEADAHHHWALALLSRGLPMSLSHMHTTLLSLYGVPISHTGSQHTRRALPGQTGGARPLLRSASAQQPHALHTNHHRLHSHAPTRPNHPWPRRARVVVASLSPGLPPTSHSKHNLHAPGTSGLWTEVCLLGISTHGVVSLPVLASCDQRHDAVQGAHLTSRCPCRVGASAFEDARPKSKTPVEHRPAPPLFILNQGQ